MNNFSLIVSEWLDNQKQLSSHFRKLLQEPVEKANPRGKLTTEETKRLARLEAIANKPQCGENVQNRQLQTWLSEEEYAQLEYEWQEQLELRSELKDKRSDLKRYEEKLPLTTIVQKATATKVSTQLLRRSTTRVKAFVKMR